MSPLIAMTTLVEDTDQSRMSQRQGMRNIAVTQAWFQMVCGETPVMEVLHFI